MRSDDPEERRRATSALPSAPDGERGALLIRALGDVDWRVRKEGARVAAGVAEDWGLLPELVDGLCQGENVGLRNSALEVLERLGPRAANALLVALPRVPEPARKFVVAALGFAGGAGVEKLAELSRDAEPNTAQAAIEALARVGGDRAEEALRGHLEAEDPVQRLAALEGLERLQAQVSLDALAPLLGDRLVRRLALRILGYSEEPGAAATLLGALEDGGAASLEATVALGRLLTRGGPAAREMAKLAEGLSEPVRKHLRTVAQSGRDEARRAATRDALTQVLVRLTGDVSVSLSEAAQPILQATERFLRSYRYAAVPPAEPGMEGGTALVADFDAGALRQAVKNAGLPIWSAQRPVTLVWLLAPDPVAGRQIVPAADAEARAGGLLAAAQGRGLPLDFPVMDEEDRGLISAMELAAGSQAAVRRASDRYAPRHTLIVELQGQDGSFRVLWSMLGDEGAAQRWESFGRSADQALAAGFEQYADRLAQGYAVTIAPGWVQATRLRVLGIAQLADYAAVLAHLQGLQFVEQVDLSAVSGQELSFALRFEGDIGDLERSLQLGGLLVESERSPLSATPDRADEPPSGLNFFAVGAQPELRYRLNR